MELEIKLFAIPRTAVGKRSLSLEVPDGATVGDTLRELETRYPDLDGVVLDEDGTTTDSVTILRNGRHVEHFDGVDTVLDPGDTVVVSSPVTGG